MHDNCCTPTTATATATAKPETAFRPDADMRETADGWVFEIDLPGVRREHLRIEVNDGVLELSAEAHTGAAGRRVHAEFDPVIYQRRIRVGDEVDLERIGADLERGVLTLRLPKAEAKKPRKIEVKIGG